VNPNADEDSNNTPIYRLKNLTRAA